MHVWRMTRRGNRMPRVVACLWNLTICSISVTSPPLSSLASSPDCLCRACVRLYSICAEIEIYSFVVIWYDTQCIVIWMGFVYSLVDLRARLLSPATFSLVTVWMGECQCQLVTESGWKLELFMFWLSAHSRHYADWVGSWWSTYLRYELCQVEIQRDVSIAVCCLIIISHRRSSSQLCCTRCVCAPCISSSLRYTRV